MKFKDLCVLDVVIEKLVTDYNNDTITKLWYKSKRWYIPEKYRKRVKNFDRVSYELKHMIFGYNDCRFTKGLYDKPKLIDCLIRFHAAVAANELAKLKGRLDTYAGVEIMDLAEKIQIAYDREQENILRQQEEVQNDL